MTQLGLFARYWTPGAVKTRLACAVGDEAAARVYEASLSVTVKRFEYIAQQRTIGFTPAKAYPAFETLARGQWQLHLQAGEDLGARMSHYFDVAFMQDASRVVLIGSDSPTLPVGYVQQAFALLGESPVVLGPALDGGYYLIGLAQPVRALFEDIAWSTEHVYEQTVARLTALDMTYATLPPWHDFDDLEDLQRLHVEVTELAQRDPVYQPLLDTIQDALR